ncbi:Hypothetical predicted protein [Cloeon dipterum]|uniref:Resistance to inhibitors of cholinesterase protein 3 N-terminal domain-containing protein n=1 Tax=Cloeon dipterum TaxID=197152 RepID=A0A8S1BTL6_9INSE|nr:Hypothetical predicted protein [Cloeon dipterum]
MINKRFLFYAVACVSLAVAAEGKYYHMAFAGFRKDDPTTESPPLDDGKDRMGVLYRDPNIYQPSYHHKKVVPIEESAEIETYPAESYPIETYSSYTEAEAPEPPPSKAAPAEPAEKRQQPYSYYYIGRKLWYIPLYFSLYFVIYVAALIIRAISRHKVTFPDRLPQARALAGDAKDANSKETLDQQTADINQILEDMLLKYM